MIVPAKKKRVPLLRLFVDGGSRGNPGPAAAGVVLADPDGTTLLERGYFIGRATNNVAEYTALVKGLEAAADFEPERLEIFADSELIVRQITGEYRVKSTDLMPLFQQAQRTLLRFNSWQIRHIPRGQNERADRLANLAMNRKGDVEEAGGDVPSFPFTGPDETETDLAAGTQAAVVAKVALGCDPRVCPATTMPGESFRIDSGTPKDLCIHAATVILPAAIALLDAAAESPAGRVRPIKVTCPRPGCNACFELTLVLP